MLARELIDEAREFHISFIEEIHPTTMLLRAVYRAEARFFDIVANIAPDALAVDLVFDAADIAAAILGGALTIPAYRSLLPTGVLVNDQGIFPVAITSDEESSGGNPLTVRVVGRSLYLAQPTAFQAEMPSSVSTTLQNYSYFDGASALRLTYIPSPEPITDLEATLVSPDDARRFIQADLVKFMALRDPGLERERPGLMAEASMIQEDVIAFYERRSGGETRWYVSTVG